MAYSRTGPNPADRRAYARYPFSIAGQAWFLSQGTASPWNVTSSNISLGGMMLHCSSERGIMLQVGDLLLLGFNDPLENKPVSVKGRVTWKRTGILSILGPCAFGVEFFDTSPENIRRLHDPAAAAWAASPGNGGNN